MSPEPPVRSLAAGRRRRLLAVYRVTLVILSSYGWWRFQKLFRGARWAESRLPELNRKNAHRALETVLEVQGLFIKVGQLVSILSNFLPAEVRGELEALQDKIPPRPFAEIRRRLRDELGEEPEALFAEIDPEPLASASLAQVHRAQLGDGRVVAVKVEHQDIEELARLDLKTVRRVLRVVELFTGVRGLDNLFAEIRQMIFEELDFEKEADHLEAIGKNLADEPGVSCPGVVRELSTRRVLTTDFVDGVKVTDTEALGARGIDRAELAERLVKAYCRMIFVDGLYHADPHPGNVLVKDDGTIVFVDFGAVARLSADMKAGIPQFLEALLKRDNDGILAAMKRMGFVKRQPDGDEVAQRMIDFVYSRIFDEIEIESFNLKDVKVDARSKLEFIADLRRLDLSVRELTETFQVPREWILLERTLLLLLGVANTLHPELQPMAVVRPFLERFVFAGERDWVAMVSAVVKDLAMTALTLPADMKRLVKKAERGEAVLEVRGLRESATLLYALGHQLLYGAFALGTGGLAYLARTRGEDGLAQGLLVACGAFLVFLGGSIVRARRVERRVRRRP